MFGLTLSKRTTGVTFAFSGNVLCLMLIFTALSKYGARKFEASFTNVGGTVSVQS